ncbi:MAG: extracellular solute-binding protein [Clostridia bacterium]|nr:extracellular solute-binding protein [Clostridia bacterium]
MGWKRGSGVGAAGRPGTRRRLEVAAMLAAALALSACAPAVRPVPPAPNETAAPVEVVVLAELDPIEATALRVLARQFETAQGNRVRVRIVAPESYLDEGTSTAGGTGTGSEAGSSNRSSGPAPSENAAGGTPAAGGPGARLVAAALGAATSRMPAPQAVMLDAASLGELAAAGALVPPAPSVGRALQSAAARAVSGGDEGAGPGAGGTLLATPIDVDLDVVYTRVGFLLAPPADWSQLTGLARASASAVAQSGGQLLPGLAFGRDDADLVAALATAAATGAKPLAAPAGTPTAAPGADVLTGAGGDAAVAQLARWVHDGDLWPAQDPVAAFLSGRAGAVLARASDLGALEAALGGHAAFMVSALPGTPLHVRALALLPYGAPRSRAAAAEFAAFLSEPSQQAVWATQAGRLPASTRALDTGTWRAYAAHHPEVARMTDRLAQAVAWSPQEAAAAADAARARLAQVVGSGRGSGPNRR